jgi:putative ABC transport system permease protein
MIVELTIVGLIVAIIAMILSQLLYRHSLPVGYDLTDVYVGRNNVLSADADGFVKYDDQQQYFDDMDVILRRLRENRYVDMVAVGLGSMPYNHNFNGNRLLSISEGDTLIYFGNLRMVSPELVRLIRLTGPKGETTEQLAASIEKGDYIIAPGNDDDEYKCDPYDLKGKQCIVNDDSTKTAYVSNVCYAINRDDYEGTISGCILCPISRMGYLPSEIVVRVKPGMGRKFIESLKPKDLAQGDLYVTNFTSVDDMRENCQRDIENFERNIVICAVFLLVAVFLGFLGSFWFRTQQRVPEIALRKVNGATRQQIFSRLISEGLLMLLISAIIFTPIYFYIINLDIVNFGFGALPQLPNYIAYFATLAVLAAMIVAGIWFPARKAMKVEPANALKDQ